MKHNGEKNKKQLFYIIIIVVIVLTVIGFFKFPLYQTYVYHYQASIPTPTTYYRPLSQPTADTSAWNSYTDPILKFAIKYPSTVIIDPGEHTVGQSATFIFPDDRNYPADGGGDIPRLRIEYVISKNKDPIVAYKNNETFGFDNRSDLIR